MKKHSFTPFQSLGLTNQQTAFEASSYRELMEKRRSIRNFSNKPIEKSVIENLLMTASSAPSGANKQPWVFCAISDSGIKSAIRKAAEQEEYINYHGRMSDEWLEDLEQFATDWHKPFLEEAPWIIVAFKKVYDMDQGSKSKNYYVNESIGIATGFLISAIHNAGLVTLTHTPSPMQFLHKILERPTNEKPFLLLPIGYPKEGETVPVLTKKTENEVIVYF